MLHLPYNTFKRATLLCGSLLRPIRPQCELVLVFTTVIPFESLFGVSTESLLYGLYYFSAFAKKDPCSRIGRGTYAYPRLHQNRNTHQLPRQGELGGAGGAAEAGLRFAGERSIALELENATRAPPPPPPPPPAPAPTLRMKLQPGICPVLGFWHHAIRRYHGSPLGFPVHYQYLEY